MLDGVEVASDEDVLVDKGGFYLYELPFAMHHFDNCRGKEVELSVFGAVEAVDDSIRRLLDPGGNRLDITEYVPLFLPVGSSHF